jgi:glycosyltransferase involved in cell wall biosynthesis
MKRLLAMAYFFPPLAGGGVHRVLSFARHLPEHGWAVTVVCAGEDDYWVRDDSLLARVPEGTEVIRVPGGSALSAWLKMRGGGTGRRRGGQFAGLRALANWWLLPDSYVGWSRKARAAAQRRIRAGGIDVLLSTSPPDSVHLGAADVAAHEHLPWVADFRDPWTGLGWFTPPTPWHRARQLAMEKRVLERADLVLTASRTHFDTLGFTPGTRVRRAEHLPNGFEPAAAASGAGAEIDAEHFRLVFTGTLNLMEDAGTLLEAVYEMLAKVPEARRRLRVELAGPYDVDYEDRAEALGLKGIVRFPGALTHAQARALQRSADALLLWRPRGQGFRAMVPGKLYEYLDAGRPIIALLPADDEAAGLVERSGGTVLAPNARAALARELETRYMAWKERGRIADARPAWLDEHARERLAARLAGWLDELAASRREA